jgi:segregation and condensation protein A
VIDQSQSTSAAESEPAWQDDDFTVRLERVFSGPMDLLLHLVREQEVEICEIEIHSIVRDYLDYLKHLTELDIEAAGDFVLMAATLMAIKSRSLLPKEELDLEEELDPRDELIERLMEFRRFRGAAEDLEVRLLDRGKLFERGWHGDVKASRPEPMLDLGDLTAWDLLGHWSRLQRETQMNQPRHITGDRRPLRFYVTGLADALLRRRTSTLREIVDHDLGDAPSREGLIGSFCAVLELAKLGLVSVDQDDVHGDIRLTLTAGSAEEIEEILSSATMDEEVDEAQRAEAERQLDAVGVVSSDELIDDEPTAAAHGEGALDHSEHDVAELEPTLSELAPDLPADVEHTYTVEGEDEKLLRRDGDEVEGDRRDD